MLATVFFGPDAAVQPGKAFTVRATDIIEQTEDTIRQRVDQQVLEHRTMVRERALAQANQCIRTLWFEPGEWVTTRARPYLPNLAYLQSCRRGPFQVVARYRLTYQLLYTDGVLLPSKVPGDALMVYHYREGDNLANRTPHSPDGNEADTEDPSDESSGSDDSASNGFGAGGDYTDGSSSSSNEASSGSGTEDRDMYMAVW
ncbi:hypothetical protein GGH12_003751 [Coemansia sp. RSA 1822]|nr:hypothetical protein LPJ76_003468 [Coemansia sp. RSA 638]KAJ2118799.1 hypothetical protein IW147_006307 [Coemansia sp. RSA 720]KAJ2561771.1 hypothetical protein GGH12_003751 [Coemansia sp. RSA 1822]